MNDFKLCENGHYYPKGLDECPYCPKSDAAPQPQLPKQGREDFDLEKTLMSPKEDKPTDIFKKPKEDLSRTKIFGQDDSSFSANFPVEFQQKSPSVGRKLVGWLVSFTMDPLGIDFHLYEGRNSIGADAGCDIVVPGDPAVSGRHMTILYRMGTFKFKDEFSTNGTFVNDVFIEEGNLKDGDQIKIGETIFKFRSIA